MNPTLNKHRKNAPKRQTQIAQGAGLGLKIPLTILLLLVGIASSARAAGIQQWELSPYRIQLHIAIDTSSRPQPSLSQELVAALDDRIQSTLYPFWSVKISLAEGPSRYRMITDMAGLDENSIDAVASQFDKQIFLGVRATSLGYVLECREYDCYTGRWGLVTRRDARQPLMLTEQCFELLRSTFAPLATLRRTVDDSAGEEIAILFKGDQIPRRTDEKLFVSSGDLFQPLRVRVNRSGKIRAGTIAPIPWTYLEIEDDLRCRVHSGIGRPLGVRRRAGTEYIALAMKHLGESSRVRFVSRHDRSKGLAGYEVFRQNQDEKSSVLLGLTDSTGTIVVSSGDQHVATLLLRGNSQLVAKVPIVVGAASLIEVPVADDTARLRAQAALTSLREQLIDTVALRNILMARVRDRLKKGNFDAAQKLLAEMDDLPSRSRFDRLISSVEQRTANRSSDAKVQARIERLFADTRKLLGKFLNTREITVLQQEVSAARRSESLPDNK